MSEQDRIQAAESYIRALRTGERSAALRAAPHLAEDVVLTSGNNELKGYDAVLEHITGLWPNTAVYLMGGWGDPVINGDEAVVEGEFPAFGAGAAGMTVTFSSDNDQIQTVVERRRTMARGPSPRPRSRSSPAARPDQQRLANGTPMVVSYVNGRWRTRALPSWQRAGRYSPTQLGIWLRSAEGGLTKALKTNPQISLLYRRQPARDRRS